MNINDERTASPMAGDPSDRVRTHANPGEGNAHGDMRSSTDDPQWGGLHGGWNAPDDTGAYSRSMPPFAVPAGRSDYTRHESAFFLDYLRNNLPAILIVCIVAAAIGVAAGVYFAAGPDGHAAVSKPAEANPRPVRISESPSPSEKMMLRIEEMRKIAAEDAADTGAVASGPGAGSPLTAVGRTEKASDKGMEAQLPQPATTNQPGRPCTAASMALALCDHQ
ncbi:hypothetical protein [Noviherbaspirillum aerium]|uniref:hypothetical protein n=1 Tax=Noviherbaspirillum aerium TaxID=2588497 RepID=UPI00124C8640|nr:hypothetical protein [Noviherbaspirillum aerium]